MRSVFECIYRLTRGKGRIKMEGRTKERSTSELDLFLAIALQCERTADGFVKWRFHSIKRGYSEMPHWSTSVPQAMELLSVAPRWGVWRMGSGYACNISEPQEIEGNEYWRTVAEATGATESLAISRAVLAYLNTDFRCACKICKCYSYVDYPGQLCATCKNKDHKNLRRSLDEQANLET